MRALAVACVWACLARAAAAEGWEVAVSGGKVFPFYGQAFTYDPGALSAPFPGVTLEQRGVFELDARGGLALSAALTRALGRHTAVEARIDTADVRVRTLGARYRLRAELPAPLPPLTTDVDLGSGQIDLERLRPLSLNLRLHGGTRPRVAASAGVSWLPAFRFAVDQAIGIGVPSIGGSRLPHDVTRASLRAEALPSQRGQGRLGGNAGLALHLPLGARASLVLDGRYFFFQEQTLEWGRVESDLPLPAFQESLLRQVEERLEPVVFNPTFFHASLGIALRF
ncbi:MAG TPA: hypothetical protein VMR21_04815 [Vicinamibacteria bacterium]|nr:hypothetical protein [Vicinamibacteria bacterium]